MAKASRSRPRRPGRGGRRSAACGRRSAPSGLPLLAATDVGGPGVALAAAAGLLAGGLLLAAELLLDGLVELPPIEGHEAPSSLAAALVAQAPRGAREKPAGRSYCLDFTR